MDEKPLWTRNWKAVLLPVFSGAVVIWMLIRCFQIPFRGMPYRDPGWFAVPFAPLVLVAASILLLIGRRWGYVAALIGAALPLPWLFMTESRVSGNSWIAINASDAYSGVSYVRYFQLRILSVVLLLTTAIWAATRLLPSNLRIRKHSVNQWTWPALLITFSATSYWFATFALPYRQPILVDAMRPEISILHVVKHGIVFHETNLIFYRGGLYLLRRGDRRLFNYGFEEVYQEGFLSSDLIANLKRIQTLPALQNTLSEAPRSLWAYRGEGWYTETNSFAVAAFTSENSTAPPPELAAFFHEV